MLLADSCRPHAHTRTLWQTNQTPYPMSPDDKRLTRRELDIMSALWDLGEATVNEVRDKLKLPLAYTTVSSVIRLLEMKGYVSHRRGDGKTHIYFPIVAARAVGDSALGRLLNKIYGGSPVRLFADLVERRKLSEKEIEGMRALLEQRTSKRPRRS